MPPPVLTTFYLEMTGSVISDPSIHPGSVPVSMQSSTHPSQGLSLLPWTMILQHVVQEFEKKKKAIKPHSSASSELMYHHTETNKMSIRSDLESGEIKSAVHNFLYCPMIINFELKYLSWLLQRSYLLDVHVNGFMLSTIITNLYVLHKTVNSDFEEFFAL